METAYSTGETAPRPLDLSVIIPLSERWYRLADLYGEYRDALDGLGLQYEMIYVLDGHHERTFNELCELKEQGAKFRIIQLGKKFGEATALEAGFAESHGDWILTLPPYYQFEAADLPSLFESRDDFDMIIGRRWPRTDSRINQWLSGVFHGLVNWMTNSEFSDLSSGARLMRRQVMEEIPVYGDQHRFLPVLASRRGFRVSEANLRQSSKELFRRVPAFGAYPRRLLDLLTVFFLVKFTKKPLRFFGLIGLGVSSVGGLWTLVLVVQRLVYDQALAQRPALLLATLLVVLGVQIFALGLVGEILIYTHAREIREYTVEKVVN